MSKKKHQLNKNALKHRSGIKKKGISDAGSHFHPIQGTKSNDETNDFSIIAAAEKTYSTRKERSTNSQQRKSSDRRNAGGKVLSIKKGVISSSKAFEKSSCHNYFSNGRNPEITFETLALRATQKLSNFKEIDTDLTSKENGFDLKCQSLGLQSRRAYMVELAKVVDASDVILQVLDARDPIGSRSTSVEESIQSRPNKKLILVLNKVDLVPQAIASKWIELLKTDYPTIAFKSSTQENGNLNQMSGSACKANKKMLTQSGSIGANDLMNLLKNYCRNLDIKTAITVGIIGYPNVGKSSIINSLKRSRAVGVSSKPGFTKSMQGVQLDRYVKLLDSPGVVFNESDESSLLIRNCVDIHSMNDPISAVQTILEKCNKDEIKKIYFMDDGDLKDTTTFLSTLAGKYKKFKKGGCIDQDAAARLVLQNFKSGKITYYTMPPVTLGSRATISKIGGTKLVPSFGPEFNPLKSSTNCKQK